MLSRVRFLFSLTLVVCAASAQAAEFESQSPRLTLGMDRATGTAFSARSEGSQVEVKIDLAGRKSVVALVDYATEALTLKSLVTGTQQPARLDADNIARLTALRASLNAPTHQAGEALANVVELLSEAPAGILVNIDSRTGRKGSARAYDSLCEAREATARYDIDGKTYTEEAKGLGCYTPANECLGRCGAGCGDNPFGNPAAVQRITQECLNHDLCARAYGDSFGECEDEWNAAADGYLFAPDCASLTGTWRNGKGAAMRLTQNEDEEVSGRIDTRSGACRYRISEGEHAGRNFELLAKLVDSTARCCPRLTYRGVIRRSCDRARVEWTNACANEGLKVFNRQ